VGTCTACRTPGHRRDGKCPLKTTPVVTIVPDLPAEDLEPESEPSPPVTDPLTRIAELREALDALTADIDIHQKIRARVDERLVEAYDRRAELEVEIRHLRALR